MNRGGGTRHYEFARYVVHSGHRFTVVASDLNYLTGQRVVGETGDVVDETIEGVRILRASTYPALHRSFVWRVISFLSFMITSVRTAWRAGPVDLVIGTSPPIFQAVSAWLVSRLRRCPFLLEIRDLWPEFAIDMGVLTNPLLIALSRWLERFLYAQATHIVVNSPAYREYLIEHCTGQKIKIADIVDKYDALAPLTHSRAASGSRAAPLACLVDLRGCFESDQIHSEKHSWLGVYVFLYESVSDH